MKLTLECRQAADADSPFLGISDGEKFYEFSEEVSPEEILRVQSIMKYEQNLLDKGYSETFAYCGTSLETCGPDVLPDILKGKNETQN